MKTIGEKGKCLSCQYCSSVDGNWTVAWCLYKKIRLLCRVKVERPVKNWEIWENQHYGEALELLKNKVNPSWCPFRNEESRK